MARFSPEDRETIWDVPETGVPVKRIAKHLGRQNSSLRKFIADAGGTRPTPRERSDLRLSLKAGGDLPGAGGRLFDPGHRRGPGPLSLDGVPGGQRQRRRRKYRALVADRAASRRALRPKRAKLAQCRRLRGVVERKLEAKWSPQQISAWLALEHPDRPEMQVSHETIYQSLFVQSRGALRKELHSCLRTGRAMRRAKAYTKGNVGQGQLKNMVMISRASGRGEGPGGAGPLGRRLDLRQEDDLHRDSRRAPQPLRDLAQAPQRPRRRGGAQGHDQAHLDPPDSGATLHHLGPGQGDGRAR